MKLASNSSNKRQRPSTASPAAIQDHRVVIVRSDQARSRIADLSAFIQGIEEERDTATAKVSELEVTVGELERDSDRIADLESNVTYWRKDRDEQKTAKDNYEMELRKCKDEIQRLNAVNATVNKEGEAHKKMNKNKDTQIDRLTTENLKLRSDMAASSSQHKDSLAELDFRLQERIAHCQHMEETLNASILEAKRLKAELAEIKEELARTDEQLKKELASRDGEKQENIHFREDMRRLELLFVDAYKISPEGTGYLIGSGKMLSLYSIARAWARDVGFNGDPTYHIKCIETNAFTTVVRSPAVSRFTRDIADIIGLDTVPEFHFRFSDYPIGAEQPAIRWTVYNPHDQLTLIAKLIYIAKADRESTTMQAMVMDGHVVTATCTKNKTTGEANIVLALNVVNRAGIAQPHHIDFVRPVDGNEVYFPDSYDFMVGEAVVV